jgi:putative flippase GtrA
MRADLERAVRWGVKSVGGLVANLALLTVWVDGVGFAAWWAVGINWVLISLAGFVVSDRWVFGDTPSPSGAVMNAKRYVSMQTVMASGKAANYLVYICILGWVDYRVAWTVGAVATFAITFAGNRWLWVSSNQAPRVDS